VTVTASSDAGITWTVSGGCTVVTKDKAAVTVKSASARTCHVTARTTAATSSVKVTFSRAVADAIAFAGKPTSLSRGQSVVVSATTKSSRTATWVAVGACTVQSIDSTHTRITAKRQRGTCTIKVTVANSAAWIGTSNTLVIKVN
jgi:hypothetical protein